MFERFTERARRVIVLSQEEARTLKHGHIDTAHLLLGRLREEEGLAARVLTSLGLSVEQVRAALIGVAGEDDEAVTAMPIPFTSRARLLTADVVFRGPLPRPLFTSRTTPTKEASPR